MGDTKKIRHNYWQRTFGDKWIIVILMGSLCILIISLSPAIIFYEDLKFDKIKFTEEWLKNILSLTVIFLILNFFNYTINLKRNKNKIRVYINSCIILIKNLKKNYKNDMVEKNIASLDLIEKFLIKIQNEEEFIYIMEHFEEFDDYSTLMLRLKNISNSDNQSEIDETEQELTVIEQKLKKYYEWIKKS